MANIKENKYVDLSQMVEHPDKYTTAERSLLNAKNILALEGDVDQINGHLEVLITPEHLWFGDGTFLSTQWTRAEDIISNEDVRLNDRINEEKDYLEDLIHQTYDELDELKVDKVYYLDGRDREVEFAYHNDADVAGLTIGVQSAYHEEEPDAPFVGAKIIFEENDEGTYFYHTLEDETGEAIGYRVEKPESFTDKQYVDLAIKEVSDELTNLENSVSSDKGIITWEGTGTLTSTPENLVATSFTQFGDTTIVNIVEDTDYTYIDRYVAGAGAMWFTLELEYTDTQDGEITIEMVDVDDPTYIKATTPATFHFSESEGTYLPTKIIASVRAAFTEGKTYMRAYTAEGQTVGVTKAVYTEYIGQIAGETDAYFADGWKVQDSRYSSKVNAFTNADGTYSGDLNTDHFYGVQSPTIIEGDGDGVPSQGTVNVKDGHNDGLTTSNKTFVAAINEIDAEMNDLLGSDATDGSLNSNLAAILDTLVPVGTIQLGTTQPTYGTWTDLGVLAEGQTVIGGTTANGDVISHTHTLTMDAHNHTQEAHNHQWLRKLTMANNDDGNGDGANALEGIYTFDSTGNNHDILGWDDGGSTQYTSSAGYTANETPTINSTTSTGTIGSTGGTYNKAWGLGLGAGIHAWQRIS